VPKVDQGLAASNGAVPAAVVTERVTPLPDGVDDSTVSEDSGVGNSAPVMAGTALPDSQEIPVRAIELNRSRGRVLGRCLDHGSLK
jgi:hypothetical protein